MGIKTAVIATEDMKLTYWHTPDEEKTTKVENLTEAEMLLAMSESMYGHFQVLDVIE